MRNMKLAAIVFVVMVTACARHVIADCGDSSEEGGDCAMMGTEARCRVTNQFGDVLMAKACPAGHSCTAGRSMEFYNGTIAAISYFCDMPDLSRHQMCRITDLRGDVLLENDCLAGTNCTGKPYVSHVWTQYVRVTTCIYPTPTAKLCSHRIDCPGRRRQSRRRGNRRRCNPAFKFYFCDSFPEEGFTPPESTEYLCDVNAARDYDDVTRGHDVSRRGEHAGAHELRRVYGSRCPANQTCSSPALAVLADGTVVEAHVCMLAHPAEVFDRVHGCSDHHYGCGD